MILSVEAAGYADQIVAIASGDPSNEQPERIAFDRDGTVTDIHVQLSPANIEMTRARSITVQVQTFDGKPVEQGVVMLIDPNAPSHPRAVDGATGKATLPVDSPGTSVFLYTSDPLLSGIAMKLKANIPRDGEDQTVEIRLPQQRWATGRVISAETNEPIVGATVNGRRIDFAKGESPAGMTAVSRENGEFRIPALIGKNSYSVVHNLYGIACEFDPPPRPVVKETSVDVTRDSELPEVVLKMTSLANIEGTVVNVNGDPAANCVVLVEHMERKLLAAAVRTDERGRFRINGLSNSTRTVVTAMSGATTNRIVFEQTVAVKPGQMRRETVQLTLKLSVQLSGRVMKYGKPSSAVRMELERAAPGPRNWYLPFTSTTTDDNGRYSVGGLLPGDAYHFKIVTETPILCERPRSW